MQIRLMSSISGVSWDEAWLGRIESEVGPRRLHFIGRNELVTNKRAAGRSKDLADLEALGE